jgi:hypothetical protein
MNPPRVCSLAILLVLTLSLGAPLCWAEIRLTEVDINDAIQRAEILNTGPGPVDLTNWSLRTPTGGVFPLSGIINVNQHRVFNLPVGAAPFIRNRGDCLELFDANLDGTVDQVLFGDTGGGPLDLQAQPISSLARAAGGADPDGGSSAKSWTVDFNSTFGGPNDAVAPNFLPSVRINEIIPQGATILAELHNTTGGSINLSGYRLTTGQDSLSLSGVIGSGGFAVFDITNLNYEFSLNLYLFRNDLVRIDQQGLSDAPGNQSTWMQVENAGESLGRFPDGLGPGFGFDLPSSGFPVTLQRMPRTPGAPNAGIQSQHVPLSPIAACGAALVMILILARRRPGGRRAGGPAAR